MTNGELDLKSVVEATFGPGAFELLADEGDADSEVGKQIESATCQVAEQLPPANEASTEFARELFLFELADRLFAVSVSNVREVQREPPITRIPQVPCWVCGVTNLRGTIISVVDLRLRVGLNSPSALVDG